MNDIDSLSHSKWNCKYHIVFAPKYRRQVIYGKKQVHIDELVEEMLVTAPEPVILAADEERSYKISLYKSDIDLILQSLRAANIPQDDYDRIYESIGKAEM